MRPVMVEWILSSLTLPILAN
jgi:hypothetical protein